MKEKEIIEGTADAVANHLPKTTSTPQSDLIFVFIQSVKDKIVRLPQNWTILFNIT